MTDDQEQLRKQLAQLSLWQKADTGEYLVSGSRVTIKPIGYHWQIKIALANGTTIICEAPDLKIWPKKPQL
jgi:hypothetical protein